MAAGTQPPAIFGWSDDAIELRFEVDPAGLVRLTRLAAAPASAAGDAAPAAGEAGPAGLPLADIVLAGEGRAWSGPRYCESVAGRRLRYAGHDERPDGDGWHLLRVYLADPLTGLRAEACYRILVGQGALRSWVRLANEGNARVTVESVTSFLCGGLAGGADDGPDNSPDDGSDDLGDLDVLWSENDWLAEGRWQRRPLRDALPDLSRGAHGGDPRGRFGLTGAGTWSSGTYLPMGALVNRRSGQSWIWQVEQNGGWHWQAGEYQRRQTGQETTAAVGHQAAEGARGRPYLALLGPTDVEHHWDVTLAPGEEFSTVPVAVAVSPSGFDHAVGRLTAYRRAIRRPHPDHQRLPVIFNDYMNTLMGDPTTERLLPLIAAAASVGAEYFCIDAGWYTEPGESWWDTVGEWKPSATRFPGGIGTVLSRIRAEGMIPGLWLEPEVVGVRSPIADRLPTEAFFARRGRRVVENGRYSLDLRHPAAVKHLDEVIDFVVGDLGVGYLKLDYNINAGPGTDVGYHSAGAGLLAHNRAHLDWLEAVLDRHPGLVIENCASGALRTDYAMLARLQLQSTSDQQDFLRYPPIMAAAPAAVAPEQAASWAYPQPTFSDREIVFALCGALLGRVHLSGHIDQMTDRQRRLVTDAVDVYKQLRADLPGAVPFWPLGLPRWTDSWLALGMRADDVAYLIVWHRGSFAGSSASASFAGTDVAGTDVGFAWSGVGPGRAGRSDGDPASLAIPLPLGPAEGTVPQTLYPRSGQPPVSWDAARRELIVTLPETPSACLIRIAPPAA